MFNPGAKYVDPRASLAQQLLASGASSAPVAHPMEGFGRLAQALAGSYLQKRSRDDEAAANEALLRGLTAEPWVDPDTGEVAPGQTAGGYEGALHALQNLPGNPYASPLARALAVKKVDLEIDERRRDADAIFQEELMGKRADLALRNSLAVLAAKPKPAPKPGVDVPYSDEVLAQRERLKQAGRAQTTINNGPNGVDYGEPEKGLAWARNPDGTVKLDDRGAPIALPYQGGSVHQEQEATAQAQAAKNAQESMQADIVLQDIGRIKDLVATATLPTTGGAGVLVSNIGGTAAGDIARLLETIKANVGFDKLQAMRDASPTGGALGQVSENENRLLQSVLGSLEQSQSEEQFLFNLDRLSALYEDIIHKGTYGPRSAPTSAPADATSTLLPDDVESALKRLGL